MAGVNGDIVWRDLTVADATGLRDFYQQVVGWKIDPVEMGDYEDYGMCREDGEAVAGVCHGKGENAGIPAQWLVYVQVDDVKARAALCLEAGGKVLHGPRLMGKQLFCVIQDPAGAVLGLIEGD